MFRKICIIAAMAMLSIGAQVGIASADLVQNGGFETGAFSPWTLTGSGYSIDTANPYDGIYDALLTKTSTLSQNLTTVIGQVYMVTCYIANTGGSFKVLWDGLSEYASTSNTSGYNKIQFLVTAPNVTSTTSTLAFDFTTPNPLSTGSFHVDDVSVTPTPIPAAAWLLGSGLIGLLGLRKKEKV